MNEEQKGKELNKQIKSALIEKDRLAEAIVVLKKELKHNKDAIETGFAELSTDYKGKEDEIALIKERLEGERIKLANLQGELSDLRGKVSTAEDKLTHLKVETEKVTEEADAAFTLLKKTRLTITEAEETAKAEFKKEVDAHLSAIDVEKDKLNKLQLTIRKAEFVKTTADEALEATNTRNSEAEKEEKKLRNQMLAHKSTVKELTVEEAALVKIIKDAIAESESNTIRATKAKEDRIKAEEELEVAEVKLLSTIERWDKKEEQLNSRAEKLKQVYAKASIEWPNL